MESLQRELSAVELPWKAGSLKREGGREGGSLKRQGTGSFLDKMRTVKPSGQIGQTVDGRAVIGVDFVWFLTRLKNLYIFYGL